MCVWVCLTILLYDGEWCSNLLDPRTQSFQCGYGEVGAPESVLQYREGLRRFTSLQLHLNVKCATLSCYCLRLNVCVCVHVCPQLWVQDLHYRPTDAICWPCIFASTAISRSSSHLLLSHTFSHLFVVQFSTQTVTPFHLILPQTPHLSLVSLIRQYYQQQWITGPPASLFPPAFHSIPATLFTLLPPNIPTTHPHSSHVSHFLHFVVLAWCFESPKWVKYRKIRSIKSYRLENVCFGMKLNSGVILSLMLHLVLRRVLCHLCHTFIWQAWGWQMRRSTGKCERREIELVSHCP